MDKTSGICRCGVDDEAVVVPLLEEECCHESDGFDTKATTLPRSPEEQVDARMPVHRVGRFVILYASCDRACNLDTAANVNDPAMANILYTQQ